MNCSWTACCSSVSLWLLPPLPKREWTQKPFKCCMTVMRCRFFVHNSLNFGLKLKSSLFGNTVDFLIGPWINFLIFSLCLRQLLSVWRETGFINSQRIASDYRTNPFPLLKKSSSAWCTQQIALSVVPSRQSHLICSHSLTFLTGRSHWWLTRFDSTRFSSLRNNLPQNLSNHV